MTMWYSEAEHERVVKLQNERAVQLAKEREELMVLSNVLYRPVFIDPVHGQGLTPSQPCPPAEALPLRVVLIPAKPTQEQERDRLWNLVVMAARGA